MTNSLFSGFGCLYHEGVPQDVIFVTGRSVNIFDSPKSHTLQCQLLSIRRLCDFRSCVARKHKRSEEDRGIVCWRGEYSVDDDWFATVKVGHSLGST